jgi:WD40 repeat protein
MTPVLISYSRKDMIFADQLAVALELRGFRVLIDRRDLPDLVQWQQELLNLIRQADTVVFVVSPRSIESKVCAWEVAQVAALNKRLAPIVLEKVDNDKIPDSISKINYLFFDPPNHFASQVDRLASALNTDIDWWHDHTRLVGAAVRWNESGHPEGQLLSGSEISVALSWERRRPDNALLPDVYTSFLDASIKNDEQAREELNVRERRISRQAQRLIAEAAHRMRQIGLDESAIRVALASEPTGAELTRGIMPEAVLRAEIAAAAHALRIVKCLSGHSKRVVSAVFSPEGSKVLTASDDKTARIWDAESGDELIRLEHDAEVNIAAFSPDGSKVLTASDDKTARVWDAASGAEVVRLEHYGEVNIGAFSPDGHRVITSSKGESHILWDPASGGEFAGGSRDVMFSEDSIVRIWDAVSGEQIARFDHQGLGADRAFSRDGARVLTIWGFAARVWDVVSGVEIIRIEHKRIINRAAFDPSGAKIVTASQDGTALISDALSGLAIVRLAHGGEVSDAAFNNDGTHLVTSSTEHTVRVWHVDSGNEIVRLVHNNPVASAAFSPDGSRVITREYWKDELRLWDICSGSELACLAHQDTLVGEPAFSRDATRVVTASSDGVARIWDMVWGQQSTRFLHDGWVECAAFSPDSGSVVTGSRDKTARVWNAASGVEIVRLEHEGWLKSVAFSPDGNKVLTASDDKTARIWDAESGDELIRLEHDAKVNIATYSSDGSKVLTASDDKTARVWDAASGQEIFHFDHHRPVTDATFSRDGTHIITVPFDTSLVWNVASADETARLNHEGAGAGASFSEDGARVVTTALDNTARIWETSTGAEVACLTHGDVVILSAAFSPDGALVVAASSLGGDCAYVWDMASGAEIARLKHEGEVGKAVFSHDGTRVITTSQDSTVRVWEPLSGVEIARFSHSDGVSDAVLSPDSASLLTWTHSNVAGLWDTTWAIRLTGEELVRAVVQARLAGLNRFTIEELKALQPIIGETITSPFERWLKSSPDDTDIAVILAQWRTRRKSAVAVACNDWIFRTEQIRAGLGASSARRFRLDEERISRYQV